LALPKKYAVDLEIVLGKTNVDNKFSEKSSGGLYFELSFGR
jgi:hypothetical protein